MADFLKPLGLAVMIAFAAPALAQDAGTAPAADTATPAPAATDGTPALDLGTDPNAPAATAPQAPQPVVTEVFDDWHQECVTLEDGSQRCYIAQMLAETPGANPIGKVSIRRLPAGQQAEAFAEVIMPLGVVLPEHLVIQVDSGQSKVYDFRFCLPLGCIARLGFTAADVASFQAGKTATITVAAEGLPGEAPKPVAIPLGLKGFTKAYATLEVPATAAAQ